MVVAESRMAAEDAADLVEVEYDPLPAVMDAEEALKNETHSARRRRGRIGSGTTNLNMAMWRRFRRRRTLCTSTGCIFTGFRARLWKTTPSSRSGIRRKSEFSFASNNSFPAFAAQFFSSRAGRAD